MSDDKNQEEENQLNKNAKEYVPTKNRVPKKLDFNLDAKEYKPKEKIVANDNEDEEVDKLQNILA